MRLLLVAMSRIHENQMRGTGKGKGKGQRRIGERCVPSTDKRVFSYFELYPLPRALTSAREKLYRYVPYCSKYTIVLLLLYIYGNKKLFRFEISRALDVKRKRGPKNTPFYKQTALQSTNSYCTNLIK